MWHKRFAMILIKEKDLLIKSADQKLTKEITKMLYEDLNKGHSIIVIPARFDGVENEKIHKKTYKVGFLFEMLSEIYPNINKTEKYNIISEKYHFWITYRQFVNIILDFNQNKSMYLKGK